MTFPPFFVGNSHECPHRLDWSVHPSAMMLGFQGSASQSKVYRCVACSATFSGLASLLVHQATHASSASKVSDPLQPNASPRETPFASMDASSVHPSAPTQLPDCLSPSFYICDCGEEFQDFSLMLEHKRSHTSQLQLLQPLDNERILCETDKAFPTQHASFSTTETQPGSGLSGPSTSRPSAAELPKLTDHKTDESQEDGITMVTSPQGQSTPSLDGAEKQLENMSATAEHISKTEEDMHLQDKTNSVLCSESSERGARKQDLMKILATAYMKHLSVAETLNQKSDKVTPKQEHVPVDITPVAETEPSPVSDLPDAQVRQLLAIPSVKTKAPSIVRVLESSKKKLVSLTKTFSPVVVLETRQKLRDPTTKGTYGRYQCGRCRRVFDNLDKLTEHHFLHKKERIKCCRHCKQLIIGRLPLPNNHVCPNATRKLPYVSWPLKRKTPFGQKLAPFHTLTNTRKVFFCPLCKHSYARRWNLKTHKCQGPKPAIPSIQDMLMSRTNIKAKTDAELKSGSENSKNVAVGPEVTGRIKIEATSQNIEESAVSQMAWIQPANSFLPYFQRPSTVEKQDASLSGVSLAPEENSRNWESDEFEDEEDSNEGQWTVPLDDEMEVGDGIEINKSDTGMSPFALRYFVRDGVKRYPCTRCQKTYCRPSTLRRHLRLCGFQPRGFGTPTSSSSQEDSVPKIKPMFPCMKCGKTFNRKDNMMTHSKKCQMQPALADVERVIVQQGPSAGTIDCQTQRDDGGNWGIMSLPSVLPRRVTCECGVGFTSPRLLLEHLQKHAQESYTCPTCGETVNSWADYEVHLQIHMHPHHQLLTGLQPPRSQPLLLRFQQQQQQQNQHLQQPPPQSIHQPPQNQGKEERLQNPKKKQQRIVCIRCSNTFATRCSLRRHISWNRCKGPRAIHPSANPPKTYRCSNCNTDFPNTISLLFHQRSGSCKPTIKPVRCPVCLRWFGTVDGLQKHLLTHKQSENSQSFSCDVCQGTYPNLKSLKNHRRRIHRIMAGETMPKTQEQLAP